MNQKLKMVRVLPQTFKKLNLLKKKLNADCLTQKNFGECIDIAITVYLEGK